MLRILRVGMLDGNTLDVQLNNNNTLLLSLDIVLGRPEFHALLEDDRILYPKTDGASIYWRDGPKLPVREILELLASESTYSE